MKSFLLFLLLALAVLAAAKQGKHKHRQRNQDWEEHKRKHGKKYQTDEDEDEREERFLKKHKKIQEENDLPSNFKQDVNDLADWSDDELNKLNGFIPPPKKISRQKRAFSPGLIDYGDNIIVKEFSADSPLPTFPAKLNYSDSSVWGWTLPVLNQKQCGSCYTFAAATVASYAIYKATKVNVDISEQDLVDCSRIYGNLGCSGGNQGLAFKEFILNGTALSSAYPYVALEQTCNTATKKASSLYKLKTFYEVAPDHDSFIQALNQFGPITVSIYVNQKGAFMNYKSGIYDAINPTNGTVECPSNTVNHAVVIVGYGTENGKDYWLVRNSWGTSWGDIGHIKMFRSKTNNLCGIYNYAYVPIA